jgi:D-alanyl-D-alanine dipeptidase
MFFKTTLPFHLTLFFFLLFACGADTPQTTPQTKKNRLVRDTLPPAGDTSIVFPDRKMIDDDAPVSAVPVEPINDNHPGFTDVATLKAGILFDIRYATKNNFTKSKIYDCPACLLRPEVAEALVKAQKKLQAKGLGLIMYDCYRPKPYQQRLWDKKPDPNYVTPPAKGSMHSRGAAVDLSIVDKNGKLLDMGTEYDYFGPEAHYDYTKLPAQVIKNRKLLRETMVAAGFQGIRTEWWHFSYKGKSYALSDYVWKCK